MGDREYDRLETNRAVPLPVLSSSVQETRLSDIDSITFEQHTQEFERSVEDSDTISIGEMVTFSNARNEEDG